MSRGPCECFCRVDRAGLLVVRRPCREASGEGLVGWRARRCCVLLHTHINVGWLDLVHLTRILNA